VLDKKVERIKVPLSYVNELYDLWANIHLVHKKLLRI
jgi:hypothetical protein